MKPDKDLCCKFLFAFLALIVHEKWLCNSWIVYEQKPKIVHSCR